MYKKCILLLWFAIPLCCMAQQSLPVAYEYDASGNRIARKIVTVNQAPPMSQDSTEINLLSSDELAPQLFSTLPEYPTFVETIAQVEIKIYPNPTTENVTLEISAWEGLQSGVFHLFTLTGQLLQTHPVHAAVTTISLSDLPNGSYILKVNINNRTENWKIIKQ